MMGITYGAFTPETAAALQSQTLSALGLVRNVYYADYANGNDYNVGTSLQTAVKTIGQAYALCDSGKNDAVVIVGDGTTTGSQRLSTTLTWAKNATHLIGMTAPSYNPRARIAVLSGASAFANFIVVTASGCRFQNFSIFNDNAIAAQKTWIDQGGRNYYQDIQFGGMGDGTSAHSTTSRVLELGGSSASGENRFVNCTFGLDTSLTPGRDVANATVEFVGNSKRNVFEHCKFIVSAKATTVLHLLSSGTNPLETFQWFDNCVFHNTYPQSSGLLMAAVATFAANGNGHAVLHGCTRYGTTDWGTNSTTLAQMYTDAPAAGTGATSGQSVATIAT